MKKNMLDNKITMVIKDYNSEFSVEDSVDIKELLDRKIDKVKIISINDISDVLFHEFSVYEVVNKFMNKYNKKGKKFLKDIFNLSTLSLDYLKKDPYNLNESEKFKLVLVLVLILNPKVIIINNMSCFLDNSSRNDIVFTLKKLKRVYKKTIIIVDNDVDYVYKVADNVIVLVDNNVLLNDKKECIYEEYNNLKRNKVSIPIYIEFIKEARKKNKEELLIRDDVKDIMKDIYRSL